MSSLIRLLGLRTPLRLSGVPALLALLVTAVLWSVASLPGLAQDGQSDLGVRRERVKQLSPEEQARLKAALEHWKSLPPEKRAALRQKAKELGRDRLEQLADRGDRAGTLTKRHNRLKAEHRRILELLGPERFNHLPRAEQAYLAYEAKRRFQTHCRFALLKVAGIASKSELDALSPEERRAKLRDALRNVADRLLAELPAAERERILSLPVKEQKRERRRLVDEFRERQTVAFATRFDRAFLHLYFKATPAERQKRIERFARNARWFEVRRLLEKELGIPRETVQLIKALRADELATLRLVYEETASLSRPERRLRLETKIKELHGRAALDPTRRRGGARRQQRGAEKRKKRRPDRFDDPR